MKNLKHFILLLSILLAPFQGQCMIQSYSQVSCAPEIGHFVFYKNVIEPRELYKVDCDELDERCFKKYEKELWDEDNIITTTRGDYFELSCSIESGINFYIKRVYESIRCIGLAASDLKLYYGEKLIYDGEIERAFYSTIGCGSDFDLDSISFAHGIFTFAFQIGLNTGIGTYQIYEIELDVSDQTFYDAPFPITLEKIEAGLFKDFKKN